MEKGGGEGSWVVGCSEGWVFLGCCVAEGLEGWGEGGEDFGGEELFNGC